MVYAKPLAEVGYTVFAINHRAAPLFRYPAALEDVQRAVRFVRHHANRFNINPERIGAIGGSSGGHLVSLVGVLDGAGDPEDADPVNQVSAKVQCVVARASPADLRGMGTSQGASAVGAFMGMRLPREGDTQSEEARTYIEASPISHVGGDDPPFLLLHGDADETVPFEQSELMLAALKKVKVPVELLRIPGGGHGSTFRGAKNPPDYVGAMIRWFDQHLKGSGQRH